MIHHEAVAADEFHRERFERSSSDKALQAVLKVRAFHAQDSNEAAPQTDTSCRKLRSQASPITVERGEASRQGVHTRSLGTRKRMSPALAESGDRLSAKADYTAALPHYSVLGGIRIA